MLPHFWSDQRPGRPKAVLIFDYVFSLFCNLVIIVFIGNSCLTSLFICNYISWFLPTVMEKRFAFLATCFNSSINFIHLQAVVLSLQLLATDCFVDLTFPSTNKWQCFAMCSIRTERLVIVALFPPPINSSTICIVSWNWILYKLALFHPL